MVLAVESLAQFKKLIESDDIVFFDFWASWCGPCRVISPVYEELAKKVGAENIIFAKVDVDAQGEISQEVGIRAMPTFVAYRKGEKLGELVGANPAALTTLVTEKVASFKASGGGSK